MHKKLGMAREAALDCIKFLEIDRKSPDLPSNSSRPLQAAQIGLNLAGIPIAPDVLEFLETAKGQVGIFRHESLLVKARQEIISFGIPSLLDELMEHYSPEQSHNDIVFCGLALNWLEKNAPEQKRYMAFVQLLLNNLEKAIEMFDETVLEDILNPHLYYFRGIAFLKMAKAQNKEYASLYSDKAHSDFSSCLKNNSNFRICPKCGYKESSNLGFCMLCGTRLLMT